MSRRKSRPNTVAPKLSTNRNAVDIVTPVYGHPEFLVGLVDSLQRYDAGVDWRLTLVDDRGPQQEELARLYEKFKLDSRIRVLKNAKNLGFAGSNNAGFKNGHGALLLMLNSDTYVVADGWLSGMVSEFNDHSVGIVGAKLIFFERDHPLFVEHRLRLPGRTQHAGVAFNMLGQPYHIFLGWEKTHKKVATSRKMNAVTGACLMTRRSLYEKIGGLDTAYGAGNFEDVQYCLQAKALQFDVLYRAETELYHYAGGSDNNATAKFNEQLFRLKCASLLECDEWRWW